MFSRDRAARAAFVSVLALGALPLAAAAPPAEAATLINYQVHVLTLDALPFPPVLNNDLATVGNRVCNDADSVGKFMTHQSSGRETFWCSVDDPQLPPVFTDGTGTYDLTVQPTNLDTCTTLKTTVLNLFRYSTLAPPSVPNVFHIYLLPDIGFSCGGIAYYNSDRLVAFGLKTSVLAHEIGHTRGLDHSPVRYCPGGQLDGPTCQNVAGDKFDPMGGGVCNYNVEFRKAQWGVMRVNDVTVGNSPQQYTIRAADVTPDASTPQGIRVPGGPDAATRYVLEWQNQTFPNCKNQEGDRPGMILRRRTAGVPILIDMHPTPISDASDAKMQVGEVFPDPWTGMWIRLDSYDAASGYANVTVGKYGYAQVVGSEVRVNARRSDVNNLLVETSNGGATWTITERTAGIGMQAAAGCTTVASNKVTCNAPVGSRAVIDAGDRDDTVELNANSVATVNGGDGNDRFPQLGAPNGGATYNGGAGTDTIDYGQRTQHVEIWTDWAGNSGAHTGGHGPVVEGVDAFGAAVGDTVAGDIENLTGGSAFDFIVGGSANNFIIGGAGSDPVWGGDNIYGQGGNDVVLAGDGPDLIVGGDGNDTLFGENGDDGFDAGAGNDTLYGGPGNDSLSGGDGNDTLDGEAGGDILNGMAGTDTVTYASRTAPLVLTTNQGTANDGEYGEGDNILDVETLIGGSGNDTIAGTNSTTVPDTLIGNGGNDTIFAGAGDDILIGGLGDDQLFAKGGSDWIVDSLFGSPSGGNDYQDGGTGNDTIDSGAGLDSLIGGDGDDILREPKTAAESSSDVFDGGNGNDTIVSDDTLLESVKCGAGIDGADVDAEDQPVLCETLT